MKRIFLICAILVLVPILATATVSHNRTRKSAEHKYQAEIWADSIMKKMTLREKVAQLFIVNVASQQNDANKKSVRTYINEMGLGGIYFSGGTLDEHAAMNNLVRSYQKIPVMIGFDGEWGLAMRIKSIPSFPRNNILGCISDNRLIYDFGHEVGRQCAALGINIDFAPVADVNTNPANPVIGYRSFGEDPDNVAAKIIAFSQGLESAGVMAVIKHFPGHGDTSTDSHKTLPLIRHDRERLDKIELKPFRMAIEEGIDGIMVGHIEVPALEKEAGLPSSLSKSVIRILHNEFDYKGLIFTDALAMKGVAGFDDVCLKALEAGNDLLLAPVPVKPQIDAVVKKAEKDKTFRKLINDKCKKVLSYKYMFGMNKSCPVKADGLKEKIVSNEFKSLIEKLYCSASTVIGNSGRMLPVQCQSQTVAVIRFGNSGKSFADEISSSANTDIYEFQNIAEFNRKKDIIKNKYTTIIVPIFAQTPSWTVKALSELPSGKIAYVFFTDWKNVSKYKELSPAKSVMILANIDDEYMQRHAARIVCGKTEANGRLSMTIPGIAQAGEGTDIVPDNTVYEFKAEDYGMSSSILHKIDSVAIWGIEQGAYPGCQILIARKGKPVYNKCFGTHTYDGDRIVRYEDLYDIASMTKTSATTLAVMKLFEQKRIRLDEHISTYLPWLKGTDKENITVRSLLYHESGLIPSIHFYEAALDTNSFKGKFAVYRPDAYHNRYIGFGTYVPDSFSYLHKYIGRHYNDKYKYVIAENMYTNNAYHKEALKLIVDTPLRAKKYSYSCVGFILLKEIIEEITGESLDRFLDREFYYPMGLKHTLYLPLRYYTTEDIVPTVKDDFLQRGELRGYVHDDSAAFFGGISGNAGLFSNTQDTWHLYQMLLDEGIYKGKRYLPAKTCEYFTKTKSKISRRRLGFDCSVEGDNRKSPCSAKTPGGVYGHTGFTGTCVWVDPQNEIIYIFMSNRLYPDATDNKLAKLGIRSKIQNIIYESIIK